MEKYVDLFKPSFMKKDSMTALPSDATVTMSYIPFQLDLTTYDDEKALCSGTLFPSLDKPFLKGRK